MGQIARECAKRGTVRARRWKMPLARVRRLVLRVMAGIRCSTGGAVPGRVHRASRVAFVRGAIQTSKSVDGAAPDRARAGDPRGARACDSERAGRRLARGVASPDRAPRHEDPPKRASAARKRASPASSKASRATLQACRAIFQLFTARRRASPASAVGSRPAPVLFAARAFLLAARAALFGGRNS